MHDLARRMTGVLTLLATSWICDPEVAIVVNYINSTYEETIHNVEDLMMVAYRTAQFMLVSSNPRPLGSYGLTLARRHKQKRENLEASLENARKQLAELQKITPPSPFPSCATSTSDSSGPSSDKLPYSPTQPMQSPSPSNVQFNCAPHGSRCLTLPLHFPQNPSGDTPAVKLPEFNHAFNDNLRMTGYPYPQCSIANVPTSSSSSPASLTPMTVYAPITVPISPPLPPPPPPPSPVKRCAAALGTAPAAAVGSTPMIQSTPAESAG